MLFIYLWWNIQKSNLFETYRYNTSLLTIVTILINCSFVPINQTVNVALLVNHNSVLVLWYLLSLDSLEWDQTVLEFFFFFLLFFFFGKVYLDSEGITDICGPYSEIVWAGSGWGEMFLLSSCICGTRKEMLLPIAWLLMSLEREMSMWYHSRSWVRGIFPGQGVIL